MLFFNARNHCKTLENAKYECFAIINKNAIVKSGQNNKDIESFGLKYIN